MTELATDCRPNVAVLVRLLLEQHSSSSPCSIDASLGPRRMVTINGDGSSQAGERARAGAGTVPAAEGGEAKRARSASQRALGDAAGSAEGGNGAQGFRDGEALPGAGIGAEGAADMTAAYRYYRSADRVPWQYAPGQIDKVCLVARVGWDPVFPVPL